MSLLIEGAAREQIESAWPKTRVLQVTPTYHPEVGGIETVIAELTAELALHRIDSEIAHISVAHKTLKAEETDGGKRVWRVPLLGTRLVGLAPQLRQVAEGFDLIHVHDPQLAAITANVILFGGGKPALLSTHGGYHHTKRLAFWKSVHTKLLMRIALNSYSMILASSEADYSRFRKYSRRVVLCPNGVNIERFRISTATPPRTNRWIYWGRLSRNKRLDLVIACASLAKRAGFEVDLCICGPDFDGISVELKRQIADEGLNECVALKPFLPIEALKEELATRKVFITASEHEGFGLSIVEAMAAGCIIVCRDMEPLNCFVQHEENGIFLRFDGGSDDVNRLTQLLQMEGTAIERSSNASKKRAAVHGWQNTASAFVSAYRDTLAGTPVTETAPSAETCSQPGARKA